MRGDFIRMSARVSPVELLIEGMNRARPLMTRAVPYNRGLTLLPLKHLFNIIVTSRARIYRDKNTKARAYTCYNLSYAHERVNTSCILFSSLVVPQGGVRGALLNRE